MLGNVEANGEQELMLKCENYISKVENRTVIAYTKEYEERVKELHDVIAKDYYLTSNELIKSNGDTIELYIILDEEEVVAYGALRFSEHTDATVWIEIIGVKEQHRGKGYGKMILDELLYQAFQRIGVYEVKLNVDDINRTALSLYSSFGFVCVIHTYSFMMK